MSTITKGEREELRRIVKQQFRVLASEVDVRRAEMEAEVDAMLAARFADRDLARRDVEDRINAICSKANEELRAAFDANGFDITGVPALEWQVPRIRWGDDGRMEKRRAAFAEIASRIQAAKLTLQRQEADSLRTLAVDALQSEDAKAFLANIPTVGQLVPRATLLALEQRLYETPDTPEGL